MHDGMGTKWAGIIGGGLFMGLELAFGIGSGSGSGFDTGHLGRRQESCFTVALGGELVHCSSTRTWACYNST